MTNPVFEAAKTFAANWRAAGKAVGEIQFSENRYGQFSAYFDVGGHGRFRVSDHSRNENFATERTVDYNDVSPERVARFIKIDSEATAKHQEKVAAEIAERDAFEAPYKAKWLSAPAHERKEILCSMRPWLRSDKVAYNEIRQRWMEDLTK